MFVSIILIKDVGRDWGLLRRSLIDVLRTFLVVCHSGSLKVDKPERPLLQVTYTLLILSSSTNRQLPSVTAMATIKLPSLNDTLGSVFIGGVASFMYALSFSLRGKLMTVTSRSLFGVTTMQTGTFYRRSRKDSLALRITVSTLLFAAQCTLTLLVIRLGACGKCFLPDSWRKLYDAKQWHTGSSAHFMQRLSYTVSTSI